MARRRSAQAQALSRLRGLCEKSSAPLRGEFLRWVPDRLPLRFAALQASGKARLTLWAQLSPPLSRAHAAKRNATRDPAQDSAAKRRQTHSQRSPSGRGWLALDLRKIRHRARCGAQRVEELEAVLAQGGIVGVDRRLVEEGVDRRAKAREGEHGAFEVLAHHGGAGGLAFGDERFPQREFLGLAQEPDVGRGVVGARILLLLDAKDVGGAAIAGEEVPAVLGIEEAPERLDPPDDHQEVVQPFPSPLRG